MNNLAHSTRQLPVPSEIKRFWQPSTNEAEQLKQVGQVNHNLPPESSMHFRQTLLHKTKIARPTADLIKVSKIAGLLQKADWQERNQAISLTLLIMKGFDAKNPLFIMQKKKLKP